MDSVCTYKDVNGVYPLKTFCNYFDDCCECSYDQPLCIYLRQKERNNETMSNIAPQAEHCPPCPTLPKKSDPVNHPSHYTSGKIEVIDFIEDQKLDFHLANALKYICRAGKKNPDKTKEDLEKAVWYIQRYISHVLPE